MSDNTKVDCVIIGGGAAGLMSAANLARLGCSYLIIEHTDRLGNKLLSTGNGKCNFTNLKMDMDCFRSNCPGKVKSVIERFNEKDVISFFKSLGVFMKEKNGYVYPHSETASSLQNALRTYAFDNAARVYYKCEVENIEGKTGDYKLYITDKEAETFIIKCKTIIIATGSKAAPKTGSDGSGYILAKKMGHKIIKPLPALVALTCKEDCKLSAGVRNTGTVEIYIDDKKIVSDKGEIQFTDYGISGIPVFQVSRFACLGLERKSKVKAVLDLTPDISYEELMSDYYLRKRDFQNKTVIEFFEGILNRKLCMFLAKQAGISNSSKISELSDKHIKRLVGLFKHCEYTITGSKGFDSAQVCQGGVDLMELDDNLQSLLCSGIFFAGEILDVDGICGGYNLQWAWSSAHAVCSKVKELCYE
ncbi:MAG: NAD(P)/FAD-dependent oxidoreductase [Lachnospira sp.]